MKYVSPSQVIVKRLSNGKDKEMLEILTAPEETLMLSSMYQYEIQKVNVYSDRYLVAYTHSTILLGDMGHKKKLISEASGLHFILDKCSCSGKAMVLRNSSLITLVCA